MVGWIVADLHHVASTQQVKEINPRFSREIKVDLRPEVIDKLEQKK